MKNINKGLLNNFFVIVLAFTVVFSPTVSLAQTNTVSSQVSSLEAAIKLLQEKIDILNGKSGTSNSVVSNDAQISLVKTTSSKATGKYSNVPSKSYVTLLWQDAEGQWNEVGQRTLPKKGGKGQVVVKLTGRDPLTGSAPEGMFKFRLHTTGDITWYRDSDTFTIGSDKNITKGSKSRLGLHLTNISNPTTYKYVNGVLKATPGDRIAVSLDSGDIYNCSLINPSKDLRVRGPFFSSETDSNIIEIDMSFTSPTKMYEIDMSCGQKREIIRIDFKNPSVG